jgi:hypothetical protein
MTFEMTVIRRAGTAATLGFLAVAASAAPALAVPVCGYLDSCIAPEGGVAGEQTKAFVGLRWDFGSQSPSLVAGIRNTNTDEDEKVLGGQLDFALKLGGESHAPTVRLLGLVGTTTILGEVGVGFDMAAWQALIAGAVQAPYVAVGANYLIGGDFAPYVEVNLLSKPGGSALSCPADYTLVGVTNGEMDGTGYPVADSMVNGGHTCFREPV